jgi:DNA polymerase I-like protein with 3'-5' exonuclease and polymerase domains
LNERIFVGVDDLFYNQQDDDNKISYKLIDNTTSDDDILDMINNVLESKVISVDTETTGLDPHTCKTRLVQIGVRSPKKEIYVIDCFKVRNVNDLITTLMCNPNTIKIMHNGKFDYEFIKTSFGCDIKGIIFDTMLAAKLLNFDGLPNYRLDGLCKYYLNTIISKTEQKSNWSGNLSESQLNYAAIDVLLLHDLRNILRNQLIKNNMQKVTNIEMQCLKAVAEIELAGMKLDVDKWSILSDRLDRELELIEKPLQVYLPGVNLNSDKQLLQYIKSHFPELITLEATNVETLNKYNHDMLTLLTKYNKASKAVNTYGKNILEFVNPVTGRIHGSFWQIGCRTGRFSCKEPNLQNIPRTKEYRSCFIPEKGNVFIICDYSAIELRTTSEVSKEPVMIEAFKNGEDLHKRTAMIVSGKPLEEITKEMRQAAKALNFGLVYYIQPPTLKEYASNNYGVNMTLQEAINYRIKYFNSYKVLAKWHEHMKDKCKKSRTLQTRTGRIRDWGKWSPSLTEYINYEPQSLSADITKLALVYLYDKFNNTDIKIIGTTHDEVQVECPISKGEEVKYIVKTIMEQAGGEILKTVPVVAEASICTSWADK